MTRAEAWCSPRNGCQRRTATGPSGSPRIEGCERILLPGDPERNLLAERTAKGLYFDDENWNQLVKLGQRLSVAAP